jgi:two-component system KDP operon response regulator KdpE
MSRILIVEDDERLRRTLTINLTARKHDVQTAPDGRTALAVTETFAPDLVLLDLGLPDMDGVDVVTRLRRNSTVPVIVLSAREGETAKVAALDAGADDYVTKPFGMEELLARMRAALRRGVLTDGEPVVETSTLSIDLRAKRVLRDGDEVKLTPTEWKVLEVLVRSPGRLVTGRELLREVWGPSYGEETNYLRVYLAHLRRKLEVSPGDPRHLITEPGLGYRFEP